MGRPPTISDDDLLRHARKVFLEHGIRATTAQVAQRAGVSEALIFKRFGTKDELFLKCMQVELATDDQDWLSGLEGRIGRGDLRANLVEIGIAAIDFFRKLMPLIMMSWSNLDSRDLAKAHGHPQAPPFESRRRVEAFFEAERLRGRIRSCDTEVLARFYLGSLFNFVTWEMTLGAHDPRPLGAEAYVRGVVDLLWTGIAPGPKR